MNEQNNRNDTTEGNTENKKAQEIDHDEISKGSENDYLLVGHQHWSHLLARLEQLRDSLKLFLKSINKKTGYLFLSGAIVIGIVAGGLFGIHVWRASHGFELKKQLPVHFETAPSVVIKPNLNAQAQVPAKPKPSLPIDDQLQSEIQQIRSSLESSNEGMQQTLQVIEAHLSALPSNQDIQDLQENLSKPNEQITNTLDRITHSVNQIVAQTAQKSWVDPSTVEAYFQLVAVQGFSDGMRAVIDVDGHQMTLSDDEECPACRGWQLDHMDFSTQTAVFKKDLADKTLFVSLRAN